MNADSVRVGTGLREWNDIIGETFAGCVVDAAERRFNGELWSCRIKDMHLVRIRAEPCKAQRWHTTLPGRSSGSVLLHLQAEGRSVNRQHGRSAATDPGDGVLCDPDRAYSVDFLTPCEMFVLELPLLGVLSREPGFDLESFAGRKIEPRRSQLLVCFLRAAWQQRDCLGSDPDWVECVSRIGVDLAMGAISRAGGHVASGGCAQLRRAVIEHIGANLADPALRTSSIARALRVSPRSVQNVFERRATTASYYILQQRLSRAADRLVREPAGRSIGELSQDCGFADAAYFSRCFRRHFGVAPRYYRRSGQYACPAVPR